MPLPAQIRIITDSQTIADTLTLTAKADGTPANGDLWLSTTTADTLKYHSGDATHTLATLADVSTGYQPLDAALTALAAGSDFVQFTGPTTSTKVFTLPDASSTLLYSGGALGTPSGGTLTNATGLPIASGVSGLGTGIATALATPSSANLAAAVTDETGTGALVFATSPTFVTPTLGAATATSLALTNGATITDPATGAIALTAAGTNQNITLTPSGTGVVVINFNDSPDTATNFSLGADGAAATQAGVSYGNNVVWRGFAAGGTRASPTFTPVNATLGGFTGGGWFDGAFSSSTKGSIRIQAAQTWSDTSTPTYIAFVTTPIASTTAAERMRIKDTGEIILTPTSTATSGTFAGLSLTPTYNQTSGTAANTDFHINRTETALGSGAQYLVQLQVGGADRFRMTTGGAPLVSTQTLSGPGAVNVTSYSTEFTSTDTAEALTLANGTIGQLKTIIHTVDGGSGVLTPTTPLGYSTITFTAAGDSVSLQYTTTGWAVIGVHGATVTP